jgi:hypothetical protein
MTEGQIQDAIRLAMGAHPDVVLWRNNVGVAIEGSRRVRYGLAPGSADLIGVVTMPNGVGRFVALEVKTDKGRARAEQLTFLDLVRRRGGFACVVRSVADAHAAIARARAGEAA